MESKSTFYIQSQALELVEPLLKKYFDYEEYMFIDEIEHTVKNRGVNYMKEENGVLTMNFRKTFFENKRMYFTNLEFPFKDIADEFEGYFDFEAEDKETRLENDKVYLCLSYVDYMYYKHKNKLFNESVIVADLDIEYQHTLTYSIYPEILSLYKLILESKKYKRRGAPINLTYKQDKIDINSCAWFLDDMEEYFKNRFPDLTLDRINELLPPKGRAGRKFSDRIVTNIIWGTYHLLKNHHSKFKNSNIKISKEICQFIINYLHHIGAIEDKHDLIDTEIKDTLKDMLKRNYVPQWDLPWRNAFTDIEKKPSESERFNQPIRKYDLRNL